MTPEELRNLQWQQIDEEAEAKRRASRDRKKFWGLCVPGGLLAGFFACVIGQSGGYFIPVSGVVTLVIWAIFGEKGKQA